MIKDLNKLKTVPHKFTNAKPNIEMPTVQCNDTNLNGITQLGPNWIKLTKIDTYLSTKINLNLFNKNWRKLRKKNILTNNII